MRDVERIAQALGFEPEDDATLRDIEDRAFFFRHLAEAVYRSGHADVLDFQAAQIGLSNEAVGRVLQHLNASASRHATTEPGEPPEAAPDEPAMRWPSEIPTGISTPMPEAT